MQFLIRLRMTPYTHVLDIPTLLKVRITVKNGKFPYENFPYEKSKNCSKNPYRAFLGQIKQKISTEVGLVSLV